MQNKTLAALAAVGITAAIAIPSIAFGNARHNVGSLQASQAVSTPYIARLTGPNELTATTPTGDPDGVGAAAVTFDLVAVPPTICWDLSYSGITTPLAAAHIHQGVAGVAGPVVIGFTPFSALGATSATGCRALVNGGTPATDEIAFATAIVAGPAGFYVNVHNADFPGGALRGQLAAGPAPSGEVHMLPAPLRAYDSRVPAGAAKIAPNETRTVSLASGKDAALVSFIAVPPGATGAIVTLTVTETGTGVGGAGGFLTLYSAALSAQPSTSTINWAGADQNLATTTQVAVDASGSVKIGAGGNSTHFVIDVLGYTF
jgi:hypothetical protein